jgi:hypothetical protein
MGIAWRWAAVTAAVAAGVTGLGCAPVHASLVPEQAQRGAEPAVAAREVAGIRVAVVNATWDRYPVAASGVVTPLQITLRNESGKPILVPLEPPRPGAQVFAPVFSSRGFGVSPEFALYFPTYPTAYDPVPADRDYHRASYAAWPADLPTQDMREHALPEGVLENHGTVTGYLYFKDVTSRERRVSFQAHVLGSPRGEPLADAAFQFRVQ